MHTGVVRKPKLTEIREVKALLDDAVRAGSVLPRQLNELYENARDFLVYASGSTIAGCVALHIDSIDLAEVRSLVVRRELRGQGVGERLLYGSVEEARSLAIARVYALTRVPQFFSKNGFTEVDKQHLPYKVFKDCSRCNLYPHCDEVAMIRDVGGEHEAAQAAGAFEIRVAPASVQTPHQA